MLAQPPADAPRSDGAVPQGPDAREAQRLRFEGVLREIDAGFAPGTLPPELLAVRDRVRDEFEAAVAEPLKIHRVARGRGGRQPVSGGGA